MNNALREGSQGAVIANGLFSDRVFGAVWEAYSIATVTLGGNETETDLTA